jgi:hypothetical protein
MTARNQAKRSGWIGRLARRIHACNDRRIGRCVGWVRDLRRIGFRRHRPGRFQSHCSCLRSVGGLNGFRNGNGWCRNLAGWLWRTLPLPRVLQRQTLGRYTGDGCRLGHSSIAFRVLRGIFEIRRNLPFGGGLICGRRGTCGGGCDRWSSHIWGRPCRVGRMISLVGEARMQLGVGAVQRHCHRHHCIGHLNDELDLQQVIAELEYLPRLPTRCSQPPPAVDPAAVTCAKVRECDIRSSDHEACVLSRDLLIWEHDVVVAIATDGDHRTNRKSGAATGHPWRCADRAPADFNTGETLRHLRVPTYQASPMYSASMLGGGVSCTRQYP